MFRKFNVHLRWCCAKRRREKVSFLFSEMRGNWQSKSLSVAPNGFVYRVHVDQYSMKSSSVIICNLLQILNHIYIYMKMKKHELKRQQTIASEMGKKFIMSIEILRRREKRNDSLAG